jgi:NhaP-type Na+/H+ or K+/H+ antiporter
VEVEPYILILTGAGLLILLLAWLPMLLKELPLSLPILCVAVGFVLFHYWAPGEEPHPLRYPEITERLTELVVIVSLTGCGLKLDRPVGWRSWIIAWRLLGIVMPWCILALAILGWTMLGFSVASCVLIGAVMAPTDPVLAADVQVGPPGSGEEDEVRFSLTSEAGLNDGLAFPFTNLAIAISIHGIAPSTWTLEWLAIDLVWKIAAGVAVGWGIGWALGQATFRLPNRAKISRTGHGFLALAITFLSYGVTEIVHGYGFLAVFVVLPHSRCIWPHRRRWAFRCYMRADDFAAKFLKVTEGGTYLHRECGRAVFVAAVSFRRTERDDRYHGRLHDFADEIERLLMLLVLVLFGGALGKGLLDALTWDMMAAGLAFIFLVRPIATLISMSGMGRSFGETLAIGFFGIRGVGSLYYVAYALNHADWPEAEAIWAFAAFVIVVSIFLHGTTVTFCMRALDRRHKAAARPADKDLEARQTAQ